MLRFCIIKRGRIVPCRKFFPSVALRSSSSTIDSDGKSFYSSSQATIMDRCAELHSSIMPFNEKIRGPLAAHSDRGTALPFVLLVGNHSSGKSSFINYVLGRKVQTAGVAPTDDSFTIIAPGPADRDQDGPALVGDPDLGFSQLRQFGPTLMHHTALKIRSDIDSNFIMVDSPGMIDAPANYSGMLTKDARVMDRGYDFTGVVRWFADRADIVCLFFDPDKPGTTGETLSILLHALSGMDHKLLIVLNKADQFQKIHDFARAYGSLCWNLSKVIPRKDLPRIFTMCLPVKESNGEKPPPPGLQDLHTARDEVVAEVRKAPERRMDNVITHLHDSVGQLLMHARILQDIRNRWSRMYWQAKWQQLGVGCTGAALTGLMTVYGNGVVPVEVTGGVVAGSILLTGGMTWYHSTQLQEWERQSCTPEELSAAFQRTHSRAIGDGDEYTAAVWQRVRDPLRVALEQVGIARLATPSAMELGSLTSIIDDDIPALRRLISPEHYGKNEKEKSNNSL